MATKNDSIAKRTSKAKPLPSREFLLSHLRYDPIAGKLFWKERSIETFCDGAHTAGHNVRKWNGKHSGTEAFRCVSGAGYKFGQFLGQKMYAHRVIWKIATGTEPLIIDHINGNPLDNRISNLRSVTQSANIQNSARPRNNTSGVIGVHWYPPLKKWHARLKKGGKTFHLGYFEEIADAAAARIAAERLHGFHENHGR